MNTSYYIYTTDSENGIIHATTVREAYKKIRSTISDDMIDDGATLWVEPSDTKAVEGRLTMRQNAE